MLEKVLILFKMMLEDGVVPNLVTLLSIIRASSLIKLGLDGDALLANSLTEMYAKNGLRRLGSYDPVLQF